MGWLNSVTDQGVHDKVNYTKTDHQLVKKYGERKYNKEKVNHLERELKRRGLLK